MADDDRANSLLSHVRTANRVCETAERGRLIAIRLSRQSGLSWDAIAWAMGSTRQAVHRRFAHEVEDVRAESDEEYPPRFDLLRFDRCPELDNATHVAFAMRYRSRGPAPYVFEFVGMVRRDELARNIDVAVLPLRGAG